MDLKTAEQIEEQLSLENKVTLDELVRAVTLSDGFTLYFAKCNVPSLRRAIAAEAMERLKAEGVAVFEVELPDEPFHLRQLLREHLPEVSASEGKATLFLYGLENAMPSDDPNLNLLAELNMGRELFPQDVPYPLVFWLPDYAITLIAKEAPDFWAWRSGVFDFRTEQPYLTEALSIFGREIEAGLSTSAMTTQQMLKRVNILDNLLADHDELEATSETPAQRAELLYRLATLHRLLGNYPKSKHLYEESLDITYECGLRLAAMNSLVGLGMISMDLANTSEAKHLFQQALHIAEEFGKEHQARSIYGILSVVATLEGRHEEAEQLLDEVLDDPKLGAYFPLIAGIIAHQSNQFDRARELYIEVLKNNKKGKNNFLLTASLYQMAQLNLSTNNIDEARRYAQESLQYAQQSNQHDVEAYNLVVLGDITERQGDYQKAREYYLKALDLDRKYSGTTIVVRLLNRLIRNANERGEHEESLRYLFDLFQEVARIEGEEGVKRLKNSLSLENVAPEL